MSERNTRQREIVYEILKSKRTHPTAEELYFEAKQRCPDISLATVYRHLKSFLHDGDAITVGSADKKVHYDGDVSDHSHFVCTSCGKIYDLPPAGAAFPKEFAEKGFKLDRADCTYYGTCPACRACPAKCGGENEKN